MPIYDNFGIYIHVPFCAKPCKYCRFYKKIPTGDDIAFYLSTLEQEIKIFQEQNRNVKVPETSDYNLKLFIIQIMLCAFALSIIFCAIKHQKIYKNNDKINIEIDVDPVRV